MPALKPTTLKMMKKKRKTKEEIKTKKDSDSNTLKNKHRNRRKRAGSKAQTNPFSVLHKDDEVVDIEEDSVVFIDSSSSDHLTTIINN